MANLSRRVGMVDLIRQKYKLQDEEVLSVVSKVPREKFVPQDQADLAYSDNALSIGFGQTISQPYTVAFMTHLLALNGNEKVLEIGTGSGYQATVLSYLADKVYSIERIPELADEARFKIQELGIKNVKIKIGDGAEGWRQFSPFDSIIITAGVKEVPESLFDQLKTGGVLVAPVGEGEDKTMVKYIKTPKKIFKKTYGAFHFVPFIESR